MPPARRLSYRPQRNRPARRRMNAGGLGRPGGGAAGGWRRRSAPGAGAERYRRQSERRVHTESGEGGSLREREKSLTLNLPHQLRRMLPSTRPLTDGQHRRRPGIEPDDELSSSTPLHQTANRENLVCRRCSTPHQRAGTATSHSHRNSPPDARTPSVQRSPRPLRTANNRSQHRRIQRPSDR